MKFLYRKYVAKRGEVLEVATSGSAPVKFMTAKEFKKYGMGRTHTYFKGRTEDDAIHFELPFDGIWHAVVEKNDANISATCRLRAAAPEAARLEAHQEAEQ